MRTKLLLMSVAGLFAGAAVVAVVTAARPPDAEITWGGARPGEWKGYAYYEAEGELKNLSDRPLKDVTLWVPVQAHERGMKIEGRQATADAAWPDPEADARRPEFMMDPELSGGRRRRPDFYVGKRVTLAPGEVKKFEIGSVDRFPAPIHLTDLEGREYRVRQILSQAR